MGIWGFFLGNEIAEFGMDGEVSREGKGEETVRVGWAARVWIGERKITSGGIGRAVGLEDESRKRGGDSAEEDGKMAGVVGG